jgi:hypothetical protein
MSKFSALLEVLHELDLRMELCSEKGLRVTPAERVDDYMLSRIREQKQSLIHKALWDLEEDYYRCRGCWYGIRPTEPYFAMDRDDGLGPRTYHTDPPCRDQMLELEPDDGLAILSKAHAPTCPDEDPGAQCSWRCWG